MPSTSDVKSKISSVSNTQKITKAMQMVAASKMRKTQDRKERSLPYAEKIFQVIQHLAAAHPQYKTDFMLKRKFQKVGFIVLTTDRGLCGALNTNLLRDSLKAISAFEKQGIEVDLCLVGNKANAFFKRFGGNIVAKGARLTDDIGVHDLIGFVKVMLDAYKEKKIDGLFLCYNKFVNTMTQAPKIEKLLPISPPESEQKHIWDYIYEPDSRKLLQNLMARYLEIQVFHGAVENIACEQASRMMAMMSATDNAAKLIGDLQLIYNKARQSAITQEISEICGGAEAIK